MARDRIKTFLKRAGDIAKTKQMVIAIGPLRRSGIHQVLPDCKEIRYRGGLSIGGTGTFEADGAASMAFFKSGLA